MTYNIAISKAEATLAVDFATLSPAVQDYVITYGLKQMLNDCHSQVKASDKGAGAIALALAEKKLASLIAGEIRTARAASGLAAWVNDLARVLKTTPMGKGKKVAELAQGIASAYDTSEAFFDFVSAKNPQASAALRKAFDVEQGKRQGAGLDFGDIFA